MEKQEGKVWFAMRATYRREMVAKRLLDENFIESFVPMKFSIREVRGKKKRVLEPAIHNLIFVHTDKATIQNFKAELPYLQYMTVQVGNKRSPMVIPDRQMDDFMRLSATYDEKLMYIPYDRNLLVRGVRVRIKAGPLEGMEGHLVRLEGMAKRRVVVSIEGVISLASASIPMDFIQVVK